MSSSGAELLRELPAPLASRLDGVVERGGTGALQGSPGRLQHGVVVVEHGRLADEGQRVTLQVARARTPRRLLGLVPLGHQHWLQVELRTARERLADMRAPADETLLEGLPWAADTDAERAERDELLAFIAAARGAGVELASWTRQETIAPDERVRSPDEPVRPPDEPVRPPDDVVAPRRTPQPDKWLSEPERRKRRIQRWRHGFATALGCISILPWFLGTMWGVIAVGVVTMLGAMALILPFVGPTRLLFGVYGPVLLCGVALTPQWADDVLQPDDAYERVGWPVPAYGPDEFRFADHLDVVQVDSQMGEAVVDGERCRAAPVRLSDGAQYGVRTWSVCCAPAAASACTLDVDPKQGVITRVPAVTPAMQDAVTDAIARHDVPVNGRMVLSIAPPPPAASNPVAKVALAVLSLLIALAIANGLVYATPLSRAS